MDGLIFVGGRSECVYKILNICGHLVDDVKIRSEDFILVKKKDQI